MSLYSQLFLRETNSPYGDINRNSTLSFRDLDQNFLFLKERDINQLRVVGSDLIYETLGGDTYSVNIGGASTNNTFVTGFTFNSPSTYDLTISQNQGESPLTVDLSSLASDVYVLSGSYDPSTGDVEFTNSTGGTFIVSGFTTGMTDSYTDAATLNGNTIEFDNNIQGSNFYNVDLTPVISGFTTGNTLQEVLDNGSSANITSDFEITTTSGVESSILELRSAEGSKFKVNTNNGTNYSEFFSDGASIFMDWNGVKSITINSGSMTVLDGINNKGLVYAADYSGAFTTNSLVNKKYVDTQITAHGLQAVLDAGSSATLTSGTFQVDVDTGSQIGRLSSDENNSYFQTDNGSITNSLGTSIGVSYLQQTDGIYLHQIATTTSETYIEHNDGADSHKLSFTDAAATMTDNINSKGLVYAADYSSNFTNESLVTKRYVTGITSTLDNFYVTGGTYNSSTDTITLNRNDNQSVDITGVSDTFTTGATYDNGTATATFTKNDDTTYTLDLSTIDVNDTFVTGFTYDDVNTFTLSRNGGLGDLTATVSVLSGITYYGDGSNLSGISTDNFYVTGGTLTDGTLTLERNDNNSVVVTGFTDGCQSIVTTVGAGNTELYSLPLSANTGAFFIYSISGLTGARTGTLTTVFSGNSANIGDLSTHDIGGSTSGVSFNMTVVSNEAKLNVSADTGTWSVDIIPNICGATTRIAGGEVNTASNIGSGEGIFSGKSGTDLQFKTLTSTGGTVTITSTGSTVNLESSGGGGGITHFEELAPTAKNITLDNTLTTDAIIIGNNNTMGVKQNDNSVICGFNATVGTTITSGNSFVGGGSSSVIEGSYCAIIGGQTLTVSGANWGVAVGGSSNTVSGSRSVALGGSNNTVSSTRSAVIGGQSITANEANAVFMPQIRGIGTGTGSGTSVMKLYDSGASTVNFEVKDDGTVEAKGVNVLSESMVIAVSDETTALTTGTGKITFRMPYAFTLTEVRASLTTSGTTGGLTTVDINENGVSILSTKLTIDQGEKTSTTAATPPVISDTALADDAEITVDIDTVTTGGGETGLKIYLIGYRV